MVEASIKRKKEAANCEYDRQIEVSAARGNRTWEVVGGTYQTASEVSPDLSALAAEVELGQVEQEDPTGIIGRSRDSGRHGRSAWYDDEVWI